MPKEYAQRINSQDVLNELHDVCECGCMIHHHTGFEFDNSKGECNQCACPKYKFEQKLKFKDAIDLAQKIFSDAYRKGNIQ